MIHLDVSHQKAFSRIHICLVKFHHLDKMPDNYKLKEDNSILAHSHSIFSPPLVCSKAEMAWQKGIAEESYSRHGDQPPEREWRSKLGRRPALQVTAQGPPLLTTPRIWTARHLYCPLFRLLPKGPLMVHEALGGQTSGYKPYHSRSPNLIC